jgi:aminoglycoside phosphotransferase (APT) family kinase protein
MLSLSLDAQSPTCLATCADPVVQVKRWARQYHLSVQAGAQPLGEMLALVDWLQDHIPPGDEDPAASRLSHGDFRCSLPPR